MNKLALRHVISIPTNFKQNLRKVELHSPATAPSIRPSSGRPSSLISREWELHLNIHLCREVVYSSSGQIVTDAVDMCQVWPKLSQQGINKAIREQGAQPWNRPTDSNPKVKVLFPHFKNTPPSTIPLFKTLLKYEYVSIISKKKYLK